MTGAENTKKDNQDQYLGDFFKRLKFPYVRKWLSGRASPCQGEGREFESRLALFSFLKGESKNEWKMLTSF